jgi:threonine synthase
MIQTTHSAGRAAQVCIEAACGARFGVNERLYTCPRCGGLLDLATRPDAGADELKARWTARLASFDVKDRSGVWRYRDLLPCDESAVVSLFEGNTPLFDAPRAAQFCGLDALKLKHQGCNPTGSFKDTGMTVAVTQARALGAKLLVCASTGNTSASLAAYAAQAGLPCAILVPQGQISLGKLAQSLDYGAAVLEIEGNFDDAMRVIQELAADPAVYLVNSINPFRLEGQKTVAFELAQQLGWRVPDHLIVPGGNLGNSSALGKGFVELYNLGVIARLPKITIVQAAGAAPLAALFAAPWGDKRRETDDFSAAQSDVYAPVAEPRTLATAIKIGSPVSWKKALRAAEWTGGGALSVTEQEIADAKAVVGRDGVGCEPASATTVAGLKKLVAQGLVRVGEEVVCLLTGHVLKDADYVINYHRGALAAGDEKLVSRFANQPQRVAADKGAILAALEKRG